MLRGVSGLFAASASVEGGEFRAYVAALRAAERYPGVQGIGFAQLVPEGALPAFVEAARAAGEAGYQVRPEGARPVYAPVRFLEPPSSSNQRAMGYDVLSEPLRRQAAERSRDTGQPALSGQIILVVNGPDDRMPGAILLMPVYRNGAATGTEAERRGALLGWAYATFRIGDLLAGTFGDVGDELTFQLFDSDGERPAARPPEPGAPNLRVDRTVEVAGHAWILRVQAAPPLAWRLDRERPVLVALIGLALSAALALLVWLLADGRARALSGSRRLALDLQERRRAAEEIEGARRFTQATLDALPDEICVLDEAGVIVSVNQAWRTFSEANGGRPERTSEGCRYLDAARGARSPEPAGSDFAARLERVLAGALDGFSQEYACHTPDRQRWFVAKVSRFADRGQVRVLVAHHDVSELKAAGLALRQGEERLRLALSGLAHHLVGQRRRHRRGHRGRGLAAAHRPGPGLGPHHGGLVRGAAPRRRVGQP